MNFIAAVLSRLGDKLADAKPIFPTRNFVINNIHVRPIVFTFVLAKERSPLILGLNDKKFCHKIYNESLSRLFLQRSIYRNDKTFYTYLSCREHGNEHLRLVPKGDLTQQLKEAVLEDFLGTLDENRDAALNISSRDDIVRENSTYQEVQRQTTSNDLEYRRSIFDSNDLNDFLDIDDDIDTAAKLALPPLRRAMMTENRKLDIAAHAPIGPPEKIYDLATDGQTVLDALYDQIDSARMTLFKPESALSWLVDKAASAEIEVAWKGASTEVKNLLFYRTLI